MKTHFGFLVLSLVCTLVAKAENYVRVEDLGLRIDAPEGFVEASQFFPHTKVDTPANRFVGNFIRSEDLKYILSGGLMARDIFIKIDLLKATVFSKAKPKDFEEVAPALAKQYGRIFDRESPDVRLGLEAGLQGFRAGHGKQAEYRIKNVTFLGAFHRAEGILSYLILMPTRYDIGKGAFDAVLVSSLSVVSVKGHLFIISVGKVHSSESDISTVEKATVSLVGDIRNKYGAW